MKKKFIKVTNLIINEKYKPSELYYEFIKGYGGSINDINAFGKMEGLLVGTDQKKAEALKDLIVHNRLYGVWLAMNNLIDVNCRPLDNKKSLREGMTG